MFVFKRRSQRHSDKNKAMESQEPEVEVKVTNEMPSEMLQLQNALRRKKQSRPRNSSAKKEDYEPDFKDALYSIVEKRRRKLAKRNRIQTSQVVEETQPEVSDENAIEAEQNSDVETMNDIPPASKKPRKKKTATNTISTVEATTPKKKGRKPKSVAEEAKDNT